jgi:hypothetical protein
VNLNLSTGSTCNVHTEYPGNNSGGLLGLVTEDGARRLKCRQQHIIALGPWITHDRLFACAEEYQAVPHAIAIG